MIQRPRYLNKLIESKDNGLPKIITGIRRVGKSFLLKEIYRNYLLRCGVPEENILTIDLDSDQNAWLRTPLTLGEHVRKECQSRTGKVYVLLDEIQMVDSILNPVYTGGKIVPAKKEDVGCLTFVDTILGLSHEPNIDLYVTGSNSKMLSSDVATQFRDKAVNLFLPPLTFEEYFEYVKIRPEEAIASYMRYGGMPRAVLLPLGEKERYLKDLFETTYFRDILERNRFEKNEDMESLCNLLSEEVGALLNSGKLANTYRSVTKRTIVQQTIEKYIEAFKDSFLIREARRFDIKGRKREIGALRKYYFIDTGLRNARLDFAFPDEGPLLESIVFNELTEKGYSVSIGAFDTVEKDSEKKSVRKNHEIDFYARKGTKALYIQVTSDLSNPETREREMAPFRYLKDSVQKVLVVNRPTQRWLTKDNELVIGVTDFLLHDL